MIARLAAAVRRALGRPTPTPSANWSCGDVAGCIVDSSGSWVFRSGGQLAGGPAEGDCNLVVAIVAPRSSDHRRYLAFRRWPNAFFDASCFRKIVPVADAAQAAEPAFIDGLRPARNLEPAR